MSNNWGGYFRREHDLKKLADEDLNEPTFECPDCGNIVGEYTGGHDPYCPVEIGK